MFQTKVSVFEKAVILDHSIFLSVEALKLCQGQLHFSKWNHEFFFDDIITDFKTNSATYNTRFCRLTLAESKLGECRKHYRNAQDLHAAHYPDRQQKSRMALKRLADRFCRFGTVKQTRVKRRPIVNKNNAAVILAFAALNPHASSGQMEKKSGISQRSVIRILHQHKFHLYSMSLHQDLYGNDFLKRVNFCNCIRRKMRTDVSFLSHVLYSDEVNFANTGYVNRHNMHYWANENPRWTISTSVVR